MKLLLDISLDHISRLEILNEKSVMLNNRYLPYFLILDPQIIISHFIFIQRSQSKIKMTKMLVKVHIMQLDNIRFVKSSFYF